MKRRYSAGPPMTMRKRRQLARAARSAEVVAAAAMKAGVTVDELAAAVSALGRAGVSLTRQPNAARR